MNSTVHSPGRRVRSIFDEREGVVIESDPTRTLIEFDDYDEDEKRPFKHRIWLPTRHWTAVE